MAVMNDAPPVPWSEIQGRYVSGETPAKLAETFASTGVTIAAIRKRVVRERWVLSPNRIPAESEARAMKAVDRAIAQEVKKHSGTIKRHAKEAVEKCEAKSLELAESFVSQAAMRIKGCKDGDLSSVASVGRTGVDVWRTTLGLNSTSASGSMHSAIAINFVLRGQGPAVSAETLRQSHETLPETTAPEQPPIDI